MKGFLWRRNQRTISDLVAKYEANLLAYLVGKTGSMVISEDIAQEVWIIFFNKYEKEEINNINAFLFRVAKHKVIDYYRTKKQQSDLSSLDNSMDFSSNETDKFILKEEEYAKLKSTLVDDEFEILRLILEGYSDEEIADKIGKKKQTVANKKSMLKKKISKMWEDE